MGRTSEGWLAEIRRRWLLPGHQEDSLDARLWDGIRRRDLSGLASVYDRYGADVYSLARRLLRDGATTEALVEEVFLSLWQNEAEREPSPASMQRWLVGELGIQVVHQLPRPLSGAAEVASFAHRDGSGNDCHPTFLIRPVGQKEEA